MESLDPPQSSQFHSVAQRQHPVELHGHSASQSTYSSCQQLSSARLTQPHTSLFMHHQQFSNQAIFYILQVLQQH